ncbi:MAG: HlyD family efflux transporter periplasmic adaptor subunit [Deltaproteobacteria bacterium]|nr:MAG: HlyD family efflux transporter periplasmic adaptor subunit [Deltaproteobacteria bacterium]
MRPLAALLLFACTSAPQATDGPPHDAALRASWIAPRAAERHVLITLPAEVEPLPNARTHLAPRLPIRVVRWRVEPGTEVEVGTPLADIESPNLASLDARSRSQRRLRDARQGQLDLGVGTEADLAAAEIELAAADAALRDARRTVTSKGGGSTWTSPVAGVVGPITCPQGSEIQADTACLTVDRPGEVRVRAWLPERYLHRLRDPQATFTVSDGRVLGPLTMVGREPSIDAQSRTVGLRFAVDGTDLLAGTSGRLALSVQAPPGTFVVPASALTPLDGQDVVFLRSGHEPITAPVERLGLGTEPKTVVIRADLPPGSEIAWRGVFGLKSELLLEEDRH